MQQNEAGYLWLDIKHDSEEVPAWKLVDEALRKMAVLSQHEKVQSDYAKMKEMYQ